MASLVNFGTQQYFGFSPQMIGGCLVWLDAADSNTITGSPQVTEWRDKSGRGSNATSTGALGTVTAGDPINSRNTLRFGHSQTLNLPNFTVSNTQSTIFAVLRGITFTPQPTSTGSGYFLWSRTTDNFVNFSGNEQFAVYQNVPANRSYLFVMGPGGERNWGNLASNAFHNTTSVVTIAGVSYASSNGTSLPMVANGNISNTVFTASTYQISTSRNIGDVKTYDLGELIVYDGTLSLTDIQQVEGYLAWKWGTTLPVGHPYRGLPPTMRLFQAGDILAMTPYLWFDAADSSTITGSPNVTQWNDKSGRGCNATAGIGSVTLGSTINSLNTLRFGLNQTLNVSNLTISNTQNSVIALFKGITNNPDPTKGTGYFLWSRTLDNFLVFAGNQQFTAYQNPPAARGYLAVMGPGGEQSWGQLSPTTAFYTKTTVASIIGSIRASSNRVSLTPNTAVTVTNSDFTSTTYQISSSRNLGDVYTYDLGELFVFDGQIDTISQSALEAYLTSKWIGGLPPVVPLFIPTVLTTCSLWLDAADASTLTLSGSSVTAWADKSGNGRNATGGVSPTLGTNGVTFNGTTQYLSTTYSAVPSAETVFVVASWTGVSIATYYMIGPSTGSGRGYGVQYTSGVGRVQWYSGLNGYASITGVFDGPRFMTSGTFTGSVGTAGLNGDAQSTPASFTVSGGGTTNVGTGALTGYFKGTLHEILCYSTVLSAVERQRVEGYLAWKWNLASTFPLPSTHPYSKFRP
jgi:hypothetical protein